MNTNTSILGLLRMLIALLVLKLAQLVIFIAELVHPAEPTEFRQLAIVTMALDKDPEEVKKGEKKPSRIRTFLTGLVAKCAPKEKTPAVPMGGSAES